MPKNVNHDPNGKGENWGRFLKDIADPQVMAILADDPAMRLNRKTARANGFHNKQEAVDEAIRREESALDAREQTAKFRAFKMGEWWRDTFEILLPKWAYNRVLNGNQKLCRLMGYQWGQDDGNDIVEDTKAPLGHRLQPYSRAWITRKRFILFGVPVLCKVTIQHDGKPMVVETWKKFIWEKA